MNDPVAELILQELRDFRKEIGEWKQDAGERVATLETQVKDLYGNGRDGRVTVVEKKVNNHSKIIWIGSGVLFAINALFVVAKFWMSLIH